MTHPATTDAENRDMLNKSEQDSEAQVDDYVFVEMPTASYEGDVVAITDTHITLANFTRWTGTGSFLGAFDQPVMLPLADALSVDVQDRVA